MPLLRSWDVGTARDPARRAGLVIGLAQLPLRPLVRLLSRPQWQGAENFPATGAVIAGATAVWVALVMVLRTPSVLRTPPAERVP